MSQEHSTSSIPTTIPSFRFNPEAAEFHCGKDLDNSFSSAADSVTTGYPPQFGKVDGNHKYFTPGFPQIYTKFGGQYSKSESSSYTGPHTQGFYGPYLTVPTPYSRSEGFSTMGTRYQQNHGLFGGSYSDGGYPHSPDYNSYSGSQVGSISERYDAPSGYLTPQNGGLPSCCPSPELLLVPETIAGRAYSIPAELQALHCFKNILSDLCVTCPINLEQYDRETVLRRAMDRLTVVDNPYISRSRRR